MKEINTSCFLVFALLPFAFTLDWSEGPPNVHWSLACDFFGNDLTNIKISGASCGQICSENPSCTHFTWTTYEGGTCWLKQGPVNEGNAREKNDEVAFCGYIKGRNGETSVTGTGGEEKNGKSTHYWNCCKPLCSWNGTATISAPVKTCAKNGETVLNDVYAQNGCNGGPAYACNNNQPIVINDGLSYAFAAVHILGQQETDWCCACYQLTFTDTAIAGKKLVVQVTNAVGYNLGENHFDLQIPGGGVGIFNGCSNQWGAPPDGWGKRYGGVNSVLECNQLPQQLQGGCRWRFDWFKNANNPNFRFKKVNCPNELTEISGCKMTANIPEKCLQCICNVESNGCQSINCTEDLGSLSCGYFHIKRDYYIDCWKPDKQPDEDLDVAWQRCAMDYNCAKRCVNAYMDRYAERCQSNPTCEVYARIHNGGPNGCKSPGTIDYWNRVNACMQA